LAICRAVPGTIQDKITDGVVRGMCSEAALSIMMSMVNRGWSYAEAQATFFDTENRISDWIYFRPNGGRRRTPRAQNDHFERIWKKATNRVAENPPIVNEGEARQEIGMIRAQAPFGKFDGRSGVTDRLVLEAIFVRATELGRIVLRLSSRMLAEKTGVHYTTAAKSIQRLISRGWLKLAYKPGELEAPYYRIILPTALQDAPRGHTVLKTQTTSISTDSDEEDQEHPSLSSSEGLNLVSPAKLQGTRGSWCEGPVVDADTMVKSPYAMSAKTPHAAEHDFFQRPGVSSYAAVIFESLGSRPKMPKEIMISTGISKSTVHKWLNELSAAGLVEKTETGYQRTEMSLDEAAYWTGSTGLAARKRHMHYLQRQQFEEVKDYIKEVRERRLRKMNKRKFSKDSMWTKVA